MEVCHNIEDKFGVKALGVMADVSKEDEVKSLLQKVVSTFGRIDWLVNNAGIVYDMELEDRTLDIFDETIRNNVDSVYLMSKHIGKYMFENGGGKIVNISSTNGMNSFFPTSIDYDASKAAILSLTNNFALHFSPRVLVNAVAPGWINTDMNKQLPDEVVRDETAKIYLKRFAEPEEVAFLVYYLSSDENTYINGEVIKIDGGY